MQIDYEKAFKIAAAQRDELAVLYARAQADLAYLQQAIAEATTVEP